MSLTFRLLPLLLAGVLAAACDGAAPTAPGVEPAARPAKSAVQVPFKEVYAATGTITPSAGCPAGTLLVSLDGGGTATQVGRYTITNTHCLDLATGAFRNGTFIKTAANGDQLFGTYSGAGTILVPPAPVGRFAISGTVAFTGGTGRFAGAGGTAVMRGVQVTDFSLADLPTEVALHFEGTISSPRSGR